MHLPIMKTAEKIFWRIFINVIIAIIVFGFACPYLISAKANELVLLGFAIGGAYVIGIIAQIWRAIKKQINQGENK